MTRSNRSAVPGRPPVVSSAAAAHTARAGRVPRPSTNAARPDGSIAEVSGSLEQLTPMQDEGMRDAALKSSNLQFHDGGAPVRSVVLEEEVEAPPPQRYLVVEDKDVAHGGHRFKLRAGKELDSANYDIAMLKRYGVKLSPVDAQA